MISILRACLRACPGNKRRLETANGVEKGLNVFFQWWDRDNVTHEMAEFE